MGRGGVQCCGVGARVSLCRCNGTADGGACGRRRGVASVVLGVGAGVSLGQALAPHRCTMRRRPTAVVVVAATAAASAAAVAADVVLCGRWWQWTARRWRLDARSEAPRWAAIELASAIVSSWPRRASAPPLRPTGAAVQRERQRRAAGRGGAAVAGWAERGSGHHPSSRRAARCRFN